MSFMDRIINWLEERIRLNEFLSFLTTFGIFYYPFPHDKPVKESINEVLNKPVPYYSRWPYLLGILIFIQFLFQVFTGALLLLYYIPSMDKGFDSTMFIIRDVPLGYYILNMHKWGAVLLLTFVIIRLLRFIYHKLYHPPRELFWVFGFVIFLLLCFQFITGTLLPMSNSNYWAVQRFLDVVKDIPVVNFIFSFFYGSFDVNEYMLLRFYISHIFLIPLFIFAVFYLHFLSVRKVGFFTSTEKKQPIYPGYFFDVFIIYLFLIGVLFTLAVFLPAEHTEIFNPFKTPSTVPVPFLLLPFHFLRAKLPYPLTGIILLGLTLFLLFLPWIDRSRPIPIYKRPVVLLVFLAILSFLVITGILGVYW